MAKRHQRAGSARKNKRDKRQIVDVVLCKQLPILYFSKDFTSEISDNLEKISHEIHPDIIPAVIVKIDDSLADSDVISGIFKFIERLQTNNIAVLLNNPTDELFQPIGKNCDGIHISGLSFNTPPTNPDADEDQVSHSEGLNRELSKLSHAQYFGYGPVSNIHEAMAAAEHEAAYVIFDKAYEESSADKAQPDYHLLDWWAVMIETPCVGYASEAGDYELIAKAGADFIAYEINLYQSDEIKIRSLIRHIHDIAMCVFNERQNAIS